VQTTHVKLSVSSPSQSRGSSEHTPSRIGTTSEAIRSRNLVMDRLFFTAGTTSASFPAWKNGKGSCSICLKLDKDNLSRTTWQTDSQIRLAVKVKNLPNASHKTFEATERTRPSVGTLAGFVSSDIKGRRVLSSQPVRDALYHNQSDADNHTEL